MMGLNNVSTKHEPNTLSQTYFVDPDGMVRKLNVPFHLALWLVLIFNINNVLYCLKNAYSITISVILAA